jgi:hypothetical protein
MTNTAALALRSEINNLAAELRRMEAAGWDRAETRPMRAEIIRLEKELTALA